MRLRIEYDRIYVKEYGFLSFTKNMGKNLSSKYFQKLLDSAKKSKTDAIKTVWKRVIQKTTESTGDWIGNKMAGIIASVLKNSSAEPRSKLHSENNEANDESETKKERYISPEKKTANYWWIKVSIIILMEYQKITNL